MGTKGLIGDVHAKFSADTGGFKKNVGEAAKAVRDVGKASKKAARDVVESSDTMQQSSRALERARERARRAWAREQEANSIAAAKASQAAAAAKELAHAQDLAALKAEILSRAEKEVGLSANQVVAKLQLLSRTAQAAMGESAAKVAEVAERAELSADGIASAFGGIGALLGGGIMVSFATHLMDNLAEINVELQDLHEKTGIAVQDLAGLRLIAQSKGLDFTAISMGLTRLGRAMFEAKEGMLEDREAFTSLGISMKEVETDTVEQMFYRVSKAIGKNRSLVLSDGTALELFGRGGKELIPIMQAYGDKLEQVTKKQGKLTKMDSKSGAAAQKWLQITNDLSAEIHGAFVPALEAIVWATPFVEAGLRGMQLVFEEVFETIAGVIVTGTTAMGTFVQALSDLENHDPAGAWRDIKGAGHFVGGQWHTWNKDQNAAASSLRKDWKEGMRGLPPAESDRGQKNRANADGVLMRNAKQQLATMERKHAMSKARIIAFWRSKLAQAKPGSIDYEQINLLLGNLMQKSGTSAAAKAAALRMQKMKDATIGMGAGQAYGYWNARRSAFPAGTKEHEAIAANAARAYASVRKQQAAYRASAIRENLLFHPFLNWHGKTRSFHPEVNASAYDLSRSASTQRTLQSQGRAVESWIRNQNRLAEAMKKTSDAMLAMQIHAAAANGLMTKLDAATAMAALHQRQYSETMTEFDAQIQSLQIGVAGAGMTPTEKKAALARVRAQRAEYEASAMRQAQQDAAATGQWRPGSTIVAVRNALDDFVLSVKDASGKIADIVSGSIEGVNRTLSGAIMARSYNAYEWRRNLEHALGSQARRIGAHGLNLALSHAEGGLLSRFGFGKGKGKRGESAGNPLYVHEVGANGGTGVAGSLAHAAASKGGLLGALGKAGGFFQGFFADGGAVLPGLPAIVGEQGPELFIPHSAGRVVPNSQLGGGETHIHVDARGAHDPAAVEAAVHRAIGQAAPRIVAASVHAVHEHHTRIPTTRRF